MFALAADRAAAQQADATRSSADLKAAERALSEAQATKARLAAEREDAARELDRLRRAAVLAAQDAQERESIVSNLESQLVRLTAERDDRRRALAARRAELTQVVAALTRLARIDPEAVLIRGGPPIDTIRGAVLLRSAAPALRDRADILREELQALDAVEADVADRIAALSRAEDELTQERARLARLVADKQTFLTRKDAAVIDAAQRVDDLAGQATSLRDLVESLARAEVGDAGSAAPRAPRRDSSAGVGEEQVGGLTLGPPDGLRPFPAQGPIGRPVAGPVIQAFGADAGFGQTSRGVTISTRRDALVTAPFDGRVAFAGPFQDLGTIVIIEHQGDYHTVLSGFARVDVVSRQWVLAGEPLGLAGGVSPVAAAETGAAGRAAFYVELRRGGQPVNPLRWIVADAADPT